MPRELLPRRRSRSTSCVTNRRSVRRRRGTATTRSRSTTTRRRSTGARATGDPWAGTSAELHRVIMVSWKFKLWKRFFFIDSGRDFDFVGNLYWTNVLSAIHSYRSPPKPGYGFKTSTLPATMRNGYSSVSEEEDSAEEYRIQEWWTNSRFSGAFEGNNNHSLYFSVSLCLYLGDFTNLWLWNSILSLTFILTLTTLIHPGRQWWVHYAKSLNLDMAWLPAPIHSVLQCPRLVPQQRLMVLL